MPPYRQPFFGIYFVADFAIQASSTLLLYHNADIFTTVFSPQKNLFYFFPVSHKTVIVKIIKLSQFNKAAYTRYFYQRMPSVYILYLIVFVILHSFHKLKHFKIFLRKIFLLIRLFMTSIKKFYDMKFANIDIKMNIAFFKIWRTCFPNSTLFS